MGRHGKLNCNVAGKTLFLLATSSPNLSPNPNPAPNPNHSPNPNSNPNPSPNPNPNPNFYPIGELSLGGVFQVAVSDQSDGVSTCREGDDIRFP